MPHSKQQQNRQKQGQETIGQQQQQQQQPAMNNQLENIKVAVRLRPFTQKERERNNRRIVDIQQNTVVLYNLNYNDVQLKKFTFDYSYWSHDGFRRDEHGYNVPDSAHPNSDRYVGQDKVFDDLGSFLLMNALEGYNSALLAYGQTGSGKSYTVSGYGQNEGILPRFARALFVELEKKKKQQLQSNDNEQDEESSKSSTTTVVNRYEVYFSMIEIYNEVVRDLLAKNHGDMVAQSSIVRRGLKVREHPKYGFFVENLSSFACANRDEIESRIEEGQLNKSIAATSMNEMSSRGHTIYEFRIKQYNSKPKSCQLGDKSTMAGSSNTLNKSTGNSNNRDDEETLTTSVVQLVDLAGSERMAVHVTGQLGGDSFIGSRSNTPFARNNGVADQKPAPAPRTRTSKVVSAVSPASASSSNESSSHVAPSHHQSNKRGAANQQQPSNRLHGSATHLQRFKESVAINQSLSALGNCIQVMSQYSQQLEMSTANHQQLKKAPPKIPYRDSVLTKLLNRCCLSGNSKVVLIATLSPIDTNYDDTLSTLRFADRAKRIRTHATINKVEKSEILLQQHDNNGQQQQQQKKKKSEQPKSDSSQTSNFDENENAEENFVGSQILASDYRNIKSSTNSSAAIDAMATPTRSRRISRRSDRNNAKQQTTSRSNPSLAIKQEQMKRIVSPAARNITPGASSMDVAANRHEDLQTSKRKSKADKALMMLEANGMTPDELELSNELDDIEEGLLSSDDSEDVISLSAFKLDTDGSEGMSTEEKIQLFNKMLSESSRLDEQSSSKSKRPRRSNNRGDRNANVLQRAPLISTSLKKDNPYLSNLNADEQLTGVIGYIIKQGETVVGKSKECDIMLHGPEIRGQHARLIRESDNCVYIEPIIGNGNNSKQTHDDVSVVSLMVNGSPVINGSTRVKLNHCDRLLFGTNSYFVFANKLAIEQSSSISSSSSGTLADLDMVTYDMARNEVLRKYMAEGKNEAMLKEISDYTHRPGTGKHRVKSADLVQEGARRFTAAKHSAAASKTDANTRLLRTMTIQDDPMEEPTRVMDEMPLLEKDKTSMQLSSQSSSIATSSGDANAIGGHDNRGAQNGGGDESSLPDQQAIYRERLREDTYEYFLPVSEVNAVAREMGIKVSYELRFLNGEEQLSDQLMNRHTIDSTNSSDGMSVSSSSQGDAGGGGGADTVTTRSETRDRVAGSGAKVTGGEQEQLVTHLSRLDGLDIAPDLYVRVHMEELGVDFYWSKQKFEARRFMIMQLYGPWEVAGKAGLIEYLIDQSKYPGDYLIDPFVDDPSSTFVLIGHAQAKLAPLSRQSDSEETLDMIDMDECIVGSIQIQATPCDPNPLPSAASPSTSTSAGSTDDRQPPADPPYRILNEVELEKSLLDNPQQLLNKKLVFRLKIKSCHEIPERFCNIFCQYQLGPDLPVVRTKLMREDTINSSMDSSASTSATAAATSASGENSQSNSNSNNNNNNSPDRSQQRRDKPMIDHTSSSQDEQLIFDHSHYICFDNVDRDILDFLEHGFLSIQVIGQYRLSPEERQKAQTVISTIMNSINKYKARIERQRQQTGGGDNYGANNFGSQTGSSSNRGQSSSGAMNSNSAGGSSAVSTSATANLFDTQNDDEDGSNSVNSLSQNNIIDMILTKRRLDRAENQIHYLKRTINIAEHYNKKHIPLKTIKKLLNSFGKELESGSLEEFADVTAKARTSNNKSSACSIQ